MSFVCGENAKPSHVTKALFVRLCRIASRLLRPDKLVYQPVEVDPILNDLIRCFRTHLTHQLDWGLVALATVI
jgi:hypothetical protein